MVRERVEKYKNAILDENNSVVGGSADDVMTPEALAVYTTFDKLMSYLRMLIASTLTSSPNQAVVQRRKRELIFFCSPRKNRNENQTKTCLFSSNINRKRFFQMNKLYIIHKNPSTTEPSLREAGFSVSIHFHTF